MSICSKNQSHLSSSCLVVGAMITYRLTSYRQYYLPNDITYRQRTHRLVGELGRRQLTDNPALLLGGHLASPTGTGLACREPPLVAPYRLY
jgi:hypothetical protein